MLRPIPFPILLTRLIRELEALAEHRGASVYELPARRIWQPAGLDLSVAHHGHLASTPFGPAAGPHTQLAQNFIPAWLAGARFFELKTVQVRDELEIPRPCIDMATVGYNIEWSQELTLAESAREYVKAMMLVTVLQRGVPHLLALPERATHTVFDLSVGYDLAGLRSPRVAAFLDTMRAPQVCVGELLSELPASMSRFARLPFPESVGRSVTLSTFHGCPPHEIERIADFLLTERELDVTIKLNPTLLGEQELLEILHERLGYRDIAVPHSAFANDPTFEEVGGMVERLSARAASLGRGFGIKLTNTLVVENRRPSFSRSEPHAYLSGPPLHVLAVELGRRFRERFGETLPISFSAGVDRKNAADTIASGFAPVTTCSDLLQPGGYGRMYGYVNELEGRMTALGVSDIRTFRQRWRGATTGPRQGEIAPNIAAYARAVIDDPRYTAADQRPPKKVDRTLSFFDCLSCDKCLPVCPNLAIFNLDVERRGGRSAQIAILADACNDCGNCATFCPEHGAPNLDKPRLHLDRDGFIAEHPRAGLHVQGARAIGRLGLGDGEREFVLGQTAPSSDLEALAQAALRGEGWVATAARVTAPSEVDP